MFFNNVSLLRSENIFIKSRYSSNSQWCRPMVVLTLLLNFLTVLTALTMFYKLKMSYKKLAGVLLMSALVYSLKNLMYVIRSLQSSFGA